MGMLYSIREFLAENTEYVPDFRTTIVDGREEPVMSTDGMIALTDWTIAKGYGDTEKAKGFREALRREFGR
jgi:hypothetical protein